MDVTKSKITYTRTIDASDVAAALGLPSDATIMIGTQERAPLNCVIMDGQVVLAVFDEGTRLVASWEGE